MMKKIIFFLLLPLIGHGQLIISPNGDISAAPSCYGTATSDVDEYPTDDDVTFYPISFDGDCIYMEYAASGFTTETIDSIKITTRLKEGSFGSGAIDVYIRTHSTDYLVQSITSYPSSYTNYTYTSTRNPYTNAVWTISEIDDVRTKHIFGWYGENQEVRITTVWIAVYYQGGGSTSFPTKLLLSGTGK